MKRKTLEEKIEYVKLGGKNFLNKMQNYRC